MKILLLATAWALVSPIAAADLPVRNYRYAGPFVVKTPVMIDSLNLEGKRFDPEMLLNATLDLSLANNGKTVSAPLAPACDAPFALHLLQFDVQNTVYRKVGISVKGMKHYTLYVDGKESNGSDVALLPMTHCITIKYLSQRGQTDSLDVKLSGTDDALTLVSGKERLYTLLDVLNGKQYSATSISPTGRYLTTCYYDRDKSGTVNYLWRITDLRTGNIVKESDQSLSWMPHSDRYYTMQRTDNGRQLTVTDIVSGKETVLAKNIPEGTVTLSPNADYLVISTMEEGAKEDPDIYQIVEPDDRQPGWRNRSKLSLFDVKTGLLQPLTYGHHNVWLQDISEDGRYLLLMTSHSRLTKRPTTLSSLLRLDVKTLQADTLVADDGFLSEAFFSPDGKQIGIVGSPEAFNGIGKNVPEGMTPSNYDHQLFTLDVATRRVKALTKYFNPSVSSCSWSNADGQIYFTAMDKDYVHLFRANPSTGKIVQIPTAEEFVSGFHLSSRSPMAAWFGESASNSDRLYLLNMKTQKSSLIEDLSKQRLEGVTLGTCRPYDFVTSRGDTISARYYLPPHFDAKKKYPMIVYYYGGCWPTSRAFKNGYPANVYTAQDYVMLIINPSGAAGFGQAFSARHVNTAGRGVAEDIIDVTKGFLREHAYVDSKKVGCIGASYGGFMTQYLQTQTDIFAAAISHAGISDHTSYWGEGYWGYSYSETSMANSYPWADKELFVNQSPLFNVDKIHTPILFLHGNADTNVPIGESIQMFNALKLLGRETAFVVVDKENHIISDYHKRIKWQNTIFAWFAKYLKGDNTWWDALYPSKTL